MTLEERFAQALHEIYENDPPARLGISVSGGGDSMALLHLASAWAPADVTLLVVTVDHGLRPEAAAEATTVADAAAALGLDQTTLVWGGWTGSGNLQDMARRARRDLIADWAEASGVSSVLMGHTMDDQAETVLMRLARGSGVDGLAGIPRVHRAAPTLTRPLLSFRRAELRAWLSSRGIAWVEDPSNEDERFDRIKARRLLDELGDLGLTVERLGQTAAHMRRARDALNSAAQTLATHAVRIDAGDLLIRTRSLTEAPADLRMRLLSAALRWVAGSDYRPRYAALERLSRDGGPLHGCLVTFEQGEMRVTRELEAVRTHKTRTDAIWDGRWRLEGPHSNDLRIAPLTREGLARCSDWRSSGLPATTLQATPAIWRGPDLVAAPIARHGIGWHAMLVPGRDEFIIGQIPR